MYKLVYYGIEPDIRIELPMEFRDEKEAESYMRVVDVVVKESFRVTSMMQTYLAFFASEEEKKVLEDMIFRFASGKEEYASLNINKEE